MNSSNPDVSPLVADKLAVSLAQEALREGLSRITLKSCQFVEEQRKAYGFLLHSFIPADYRIPQSRILDIGCGPCLEAEVLINYFGKQARLFGIDCSRPDIEFAGKVHAPNSRYEFVFGDARSYNYPTPFDIVVTRHPHIFFDPWAEIVLVAAKNTRQGGLFLGTTYRKDEQEKLNSMLHDAGWSDVQQHEHPNPVAFVHGFFFDHYIITARK